MRDGREFTSLLRQEAPSYSATVVGLGYENRRAHLPEVNIGDSLRLERDYDNPYDQNAVQVAHGGAQLGFLPRALARLLAPHMDGGLQFQAVVTSVERRPHASVALAITAADN